MFPQASAGPSFQEAMLSGKFQGTISPTTPSGSRNVMSTPPATGIVCAVVLVDRAGVEVEDVGDHADLAAGAGDRLADVLRLDPRQLLAVLLDEGREPRAAAVRGRRGETARQAGNAARARADGRVRLVDPGLLERRNRLLGRRVENGEGHASI